MLITRVEIRACHLSGQSELERNRLRGGSPPDVVVITLETDEGVTGTSFGFGGLDARHTMHVYAQAAPFFIGRDPMARSGNAAAFKGYDRRWNLVPIYVYGPFDNACWDITGNVARLPVHQLLGSSRDRVPVYASSMTLADPADYLDEARAVVQDGFMAYKLHPPGDWRVDLEVYAAVREVVGPEFRLMADPVDTYTFDQALTVGRRLEELDYYWYEEPLYDYDLGSLRKLTSALEIPVVGTETIAGGSRSTAQFLAAGAVDMVRSDVSWRGGISSVMATAHLAEAFGVNCELHTTIYHPLELVNLQCSLALTNCEYFEVLYPMEQFSFGLATPMDLRDGYIYPSALPGLGIEYDWAAIDAATTERIVVES